MLFLIVIEKYIFSAIKSAKLVIQKVMMIIT